jgi:hypothetical protein
MLMTTAFIVAVRAVQDEAGSARPGAPVIPEREPVPRLLRTRHALSRALHATARAVAPPEVRPARCAPSPF